MRRLVTRHIHRAHVRPAGLAQGVERAAGRARHSLEEGSRLQHEVLIPRDENAGPFLRGVLENVFSALSFLCVFRERL